MHDSIASIKKCHTPFLGYWKVICLSHLVAKYVFLSIQNGCGWYIHIDIYVYIHGGTHIDIYIYVYRSFLIEIYVNVRFYIHINFCSWLNYCWILQVKGIIYTLRKNCLRIVKVVLTKEFKIFIYFRSRGLICSSFNKRLDKVISWYE